MRLPHSSPRPAIMALVGLMAVTPAGCRKGSGTARDGSSNDVSSLGFAFAESALGNGLHPLAYEFPDARMSAYYLASIQGVNVGTAVAALTEGMNAQAALKFDMRLVHRLGRKPLSTQLRGRWEEPEPGASRFILTATLTGKEGVVKEQSLSWKREKDELRPESPERSFLPGLFALEARSDVTAGPVPAVKWTSESLLPFHREPGSPAAAGGGSVFFPITGQVMEEKRLGLRFDADGFLNTASLPWFGGVALELRRVTREQLLKDVENGFPKTPVELAWFSSPGRIATDARELLHTVNACSSFAADMERQMRRTIPNVPYLLHRRILTYQNFCAGLSGLLRGGFDAARADATLLRVGQFVRGILVADSRELPRTLATSPEMALFQDDAYRWQWVRVLNFALGRTKDEFTQTLGIEQSQKVSVNIRLLLDKLARTSVIKGVLHSRALNLQYVVEGAPGDGAMKPTSLKELPETLRAPVKPVGLKTPGPDRAATFELVDGQSFAQGNFATLGLLCAQLGGRIGIDLGDAPQMPIVSEVIRGTWDDATRAQLLGEFIRRASMQPDCRDVTVRVPARMQVQAAAEIDALRKDVLQTENEFQISNGSSKRLRLVPGRYELVLSSLITGGVLGRQDILIPVSTNGKNLALHVNIKETN